MVDFREICSRGPSKISIIISMGIVSSKDRDVLSKREVLRLILYSLSFCGSFQGRGISKPAESVLAGFSVSVVSDRGTKKDCVLLD